jgi:flagellin-like protein
MRVLSKRHGISEVVAALLLLVITVAMFGLFYTYYVGSIGASGQGVSHQIATNTNLSNELLSMTYYTVSPSANTVTLYLFSYGPGTIDLLPTSLCHCELLSTTAYAATGSTLTVNGVSATSLAPGQLGVLTLTFPSGDVPSSGVFNIVILDAIGNDFMFSLAG